MVRLGIRVRTKHTTNVLSSSSIYLLKRAELAVRSCVESALKEVDLTPSQLFILILVKFGVATSSAELSREMGVLPQSMIELIAPLEHTRAIERRPDPANNRILRIVLTPTGERLFARGAEVGARLERELFGWLGKQERLLLQAKLADLTVRAESHVDHAKLRRVDRRVSRPQRRRVVARQAASTRRTARRRGV
jgi:DNA-binding MarR family transcriptional regulator